jgi:tight adherence protein B
MKAAVQLGLAALVASALVASASAAGQLRVVEAGGAVYPHQSYILTLPSPKSLQASDVHVTENGSPVADLTVARQGTKATHTAVVLVIDESLTMKGRPIENAFAAARTFAAQANPTETIAVVTFNGKVNTLQSFTTSASAVASTLSHPPTIAYGTKNYDALAQALQLIQKSGAPTGSIIILTDGQSVGNVAKPATVLGDLAADHVRVFSVGLSSPAYNATALQQMASETGGSYVEATSPGKIGPILATLGRQLSSEYLLNYESVTNPSQHVNVVVKVKGVPGVAVTAYTTPALRIVPAPAYHPSLSARIIQSPWLMIIVVLIFASLIGFAISHAASSRSDPLVDRVGDFVGPQRSGELRSKQPKERTSIGLSAFLSRVTAKTARGGWLERVALALDLADIDTEPIQFVVLTAIGTILTMAIFGLILGPVGALIGLVVPFIVRWWTLNRITRKRRAFAEQLPDNLDVLTSALRAGHSLVGALTVVADDAPEPSKAEFRRVLAEEQFGANLEDAFGIAVVRMSNQDLDQVALVARLQREVGSNSAEVLDRVVETVRARMELRRLVRTLTAQGRLSRWILTLLPVGLLVILTLAGGSYMHPIFHETFGRILLVLAALMVVLGSYIIGKIVDIKV